MPELTEDQKLDAIASFMEVTNAKRHEADSYLCAGGWDQNRAILLFFENGPGGKFSDSEDEKNNEKDFTGKDSLDDEGGSVQEIPALIESPIKILDPSQGSESNSRDLDSDDMDLDSDNDVEIIGDDTSSGDDGDSSNEQADMSPSNSTNGKDLVNGVNGLSDRISNGDSKKASHSGSDSSGGSNNGLFQGRNKRSTAAAAAAAAVATTVKPFGCTSNEENHASKDVMEGLEDVDSSNEDGGVNDKQSKDTNCYPCFSVSDSDSVEVADDDDDDGMKKTGKRPNTRQGGGEGEGGEPRANCGEHTTAAAAATTAPAISNNYPPGLSPSEIEEARVAEALVLGLPYDSVPDASFG
eukprot:CAMPEP_0175059748 /NCGR_PEP_ID=MMETSP0052_2-20121109/12607_1 /TAXON_ID=51329 ORGANISM="Polytomella parva, Strain SAG 63-3" /NCGR_SAMPLE_ID=MMETSP0052_2 /ASSEMBLY_ACC=CAM_ASM_000194 /LENGTH=353 /DNA_ID=CAMNT_0016325337 /DNA_START=129 /DNA_END=1186 /DNA_ORIENTATION=-